MIYYLLKYFIYYSAFYYSWFIRLQYLAYIIQESVLYDSLTITIFGIIYDICDLICITIFDMW